MRAIEPKEEKSMGCCEVESPKSKTRKYYPMFRIDLKHLPEAKKWDLSDEYTVTLKLKMVGISQSKYQNDSEFEIIGIDPGKDSKKKEKMDD